MRYMKKYILHIIICCICASITIHYLKKLNADYALHKEMWNQVSAETFREALLKEVERRSEIPHYSSYSGGGGIRPLKPQMPDSVVIVTKEYGWRAYRLQKERFKRQLLEGGEFNIGISYLMREYPISVDTLKYRWDSLLNRKLKATTSIRLVMTDLTEQNDTFYARKDNFIFPKDSALVWYLGYRCEAEFIGSIHYPEVWTTWHPAVWGWLLLPWIVGIFFLLYYKKGWKSIKRKFTKNRIVHVADAQIAEAKIYQLGYGAVYDVFSQTIRKGSVVSRLAPQSANLFLLFLRMPEHRATIAEIDQCLWCGKGTKEQLHTAIRRLRNELKSAPIDLSIEYLGETYQLKIAHSIEENHLVSNGQ